jgi:hypothetical protein
MKIVFNSGFVFVGVYLSVVLAKVLRQGEEGKVISQE